MARWRERISLLDVLNGALLIIALAGATVMVGSLSIAVVSIVKNHGAPQAPTPTTSASAVTNPSIPALKEVTRTYTFTKKSNLKDFKKSGSGTVAISPGKRLRLQANPPYAVQAKLSVCVDGGATVRFDSEWSGDLDYDVASFSIDGNLQDSASGKGITIAKYQAYDLEPGKRTLTWRYSTDSTYNLPTDAYYVDNIKITRLIASPGWC